MRIRSVDLVLPEMVVTNDYVIDLIKQNSKGAYEGNLEDLLRKVLKLLNRAGSGTRYWSCQRAKPIEYIVSACDGALRKSGLAKVDVELVIYAGVDRGFYEPANAYFIADCLGLQSAQCFDVGDACNGWSRALQICHALFQTGGHRTALIVNGEFPMFEGGPVYPKLFRVEHARQIEHRFAAFTLGEGATATVVTADQDVNWEFRSLSRTSCADLCTISCWDELRFSKDSEFLNVDGGGHFVSFGDAMMDKGFEYIANVFNSLSAPLHSIGVVFPHTVSCPAINKAASMIGAQHLIYNIFPKVGNVISASVPAGLSLAMDSGRVKRGDIAAGWVGSAGMVFSAYTFTV